MSLFNPVDCNGKQEERGINSRFNSESAKVAKFLGI